MKVQSVQSLSLPEIKLIRLARDCDIAGYIEETFRKSIFLNTKDLHFLHNIEFKETIEIFSKKNVIRGLHIQSTPTMGKLIRIMRGRMVELILDVRKGSPTFGHIITCEMSYDQNASYSEWIWIPPGFAEGCYFTADSTVEYFCTSEYSSQHESCITPFAKDIDWSLGDPFLMKEFAGIFDKAIISDKDKRGLTFTEWQKEDYGQKFVYERAKKVLV